jgi:hypothetical protein
MGMGDRLKAEQKCEKCGHFGARHFWTEDTIGYWAFCTMDYCECFLEIREEDGS